MSNTNEQNKGKPTLEKIKAMSTADLSEIMAVEILSISQVYYQHGLEQGKADGYKEGETDGFNKALNDFNEQYDEPEKVGVEYAVEAFKEVTDFESFREKYNEINNRALNFMRPIGY